jgi:heme ABC exporter ATP-binding subunit CcmA
VQTNSAIYTHGLTKHYGNRPVLSDIDLELPWGEVLSLFGPNGAGKTTLVRLLAGLARPTDGSIRIAGLNPEPRGIDVRRLLGVVTHQTFLYDELTARENLRFYARMYGLDNADERIEEVSATLGSTSYLDARVRTLSNGMQKRVSLARAVLHRPRLLIFDEPEAGLDQEALELLQALLEAHRAEGGSAVVTTHNVERGLSIADRVIILANGRISYDEPSGALEPVSFRDTYRERTGVQL